MAMNWMTVLGSLLLWAGFSTLIYTVIKNKFNYDQRHSKPR